MKDADGKRARDADGKRARDADGKRDGHAEGKRARAAEAVPVRDEGSTRVFGVRLGASAGGAGGAGGEGQDAAAELEGMVRRQLELLGEDPWRPGLARTPARVARSLQWLTRGYDMDIASVVGAAVFSEPHESMIMVRDIEVYSLCEHHLLPFFGKAHIAYIPDGRIIGLSKLPRVVDVFARRLQVQERLTEQIAGAVEEVLAPRGVGVVIEAAHLCMMMRGVEKQNSKTITSAVRGAFRDDAKTRDEFLRLAHYSGSAAG
ncbi:MAG: GTP cyclohydrolase I FolE [Gemmatimonadaceae bacterium]